MTKKPTDDPSELPEELVGPDTARKLRNLFWETFGPLDRPYVLASAPGRLELAGNHTDHQGGHVISAALDAHICALAAPNGLRTARVHMDGCGDLAFELDGCSWEPLPGEVNTSAAIVRGMLAHALGYGTADEPGSGSSRESRTIPGFDMVTISDLPIGRGVSSSAAFEVLVGCVLECLAAGAADSTEAGVFFAADAPRDPLGLALAGMRVEREYFGKPCGAQDQIASAFGGIVAMDFRTMPPAVEPIAFDLETSGFVACLIDSRADHSLCPRDFAAIPSEMRAVAGLWGRETLGQVPEDEFMVRLPQVRAALGDRPALRTLHYFSEDRRVVRQAQALRDGDFGAFLEDVRLSGASSAQFLQSVTPGGVGGTGGASRAGGANGAEEPAASDQPAMVILGLCASLLGRRGAWRIHGGGFGGYILAFVPRDEYPDFRSRMDAALGYDACREAGVSPRGARAVWCGA